VAVQLAVLFNSFEFAIFFPIVVAAYFMLPRRIRWAWLLGASYYFYASWRVEYLLLIWTSTLVDYCVGLSLPRQTSPGRKRALLILSLATNLGLLFTFKYLNFFSEASRVLLGRFGLGSGLPILDVLLPVGISFYTFQTLSYTIDIYRGRRGAEKHLGRFALYVAYFPQLVAGPIERSTHLLPQLARSYSFEYRRVTDGLKLMLWGFFKKLVIADRLAILVDYVYAQPTEFSGLAVVVATYFFAFQIYCDFSAYTDIAIGAARVMGFDLMENFRRPYFATNIADFWRRWHISLSSWFRDYVYVPLGGNRVGRWRWQYNLMVVFVLSGLWHGANWTFLAWGALHGFYYLFSRWTHGLRAKLRRLSGIERLPRVHKLLRIGITFHLVVFAWIFFRAASITDAVHIVTSSVTGLGSIFGTLIGLVQGSGLGELPYMGLRLREIALAVLLIAFLEAVHVCQGTRSVLSLVENRPVYVRWAVYYAMIAAVAALGVFSKTEFIYFQF
jgi:D-alanyl-lipoteichoic acid acyltransferase DltB (MBOAT superfamily)